MSEWNPRYLAYCRAHGLDPERMKERDRERWPGGANTGFTVWLHRQYDAWRAETGERPEHVDNWSDRQFAAFEAGYRAATSPVPSGAQRTHLSAAAKRARRPLRPEELADARHDQAHRDLEGSRPARTIRNARHTPGHASHD